MAEELSKEQKKCLNILLRRSIALEEKDLLERATKLTDGYFENHPEKYISSSQLHNLENTTYAADAPETLKSLIINQVTKHKTWAHNDFATHLLLEIEKTIGASNTNTTSNLERVINRIKDKTNYMIEDDSLRLKWLDEDRTLDIKMNLLRRIMSFILIQYKFRIPESTRGNNNDN